MVGHDRRLARRCVGEGGGPAIRPNKRVALICSRFGYEQDHEHEHEPSQRD
jgi:hypothetical protein